MSAELLLAIVTKGQLLVSLEISLPAIIIIIVQDSGKEKKSFIFLLVVCALEAVDAIRHGPLRS